MKKFLTILLILSMIVSTVYATGTEAPKVVDSANLLTDDEVASLRGIAGQISDTFDADIVIVTVYSLEGKSAERYADDYFDYNGYGIGSNRSGILLLLSMEHRDWAISTSGECIRIFRDRDLDNIFDRIAKDLSNDNYYSAFSRYLKLLNDHFKSHENNSSDGTDGIFKRLLIALVIGAAVGAIVLFVMRRKMNTARSQYGASNYIVKNSFDLYHQRDIYLYSNTTRTRKQHSSSGSSTHRSSSGRSHGGRSGKF